MTILHLVRAATVPPAALADPDWIVYRTPGAGWRLDPHGAPPRPAGPIDHAALADLVLAADRVVTW